MAALMAAWSPRYLTYVHMSVHTQNTHTHTHTHVSDDRLVAQMPDICVYNISACVCVCLCVYVCMCVCVREIERDRERECVCVSGPDAPSSTRPEGHGEGRVAFPDHISHLLG